MLALHAGRPWMLVKPQGFEIWVGPLFVPGETGCHCCLSLRLKRNYPVGQFVADKFCRREPPLLARAATSATVEAASRLGALEAAKYLAGVRGGLVEMGWVDHALREEEINPIPIFF